MSVTWQVTSEQQFRDKWIAALGEAEFERRQKLAKEKADGLESWEEQCVLRHQFEAVAMQMSAEQVAVAEGWKPDRWARLIYRLAGVA